MWCEKVTEGDRNQRIKLDKAPMSANKFLRKFSKHSLWLLIGFATGITFVGYFSPIRELVFDFFTGQADGWSYFWVGFFTLATYGNAGWLREQVCIYMCPYARFQSVMFDKDTLIVSYDPRRGEVRGPRKRVPTTRPRAWATSSTARCAYRCALPVSTSAMVCKSNASAAPPVSMPATTSWTRWSTHAD